MLSVEVSRKKAPLVKMYWAALGVKASSTECYNNILIMIDDPVPADVIKRANLFLELLSELPDESAAPAPVPVPVGMLNQQAKEDLKTLYEYEAINEAFFWDVLSCAGCSEEFKAYLEIAKK